MKLTKGSKTIIFLAIVSLSLFIFMLYFRAAIYAGMYIEPDAPYGISDIIEFLLGCLFMLLSLISGITALILFFRGAKQSKIFSCGLIFLHVCLYASFNTLHNLAANYGSA